MTQPFDEWRFRDDEHDWRRGWYDRCPDSRHGNRGSFRERERRNDLRDHALGVIDRICVPLTGMVRVAMQRDRTMRVRLTRVRGVVPMRRLAVSCGSVAMALAVAWAVRLRVAVGDGLVVAIRCLELVDVLARRQRQQANGCGENTSEHRSKSHAEVRLRDVGKPAQQTLAT